MATSATVFQDLVTAQKRIKRADTAFGAAQQSLVAAQVEMEEARRDVVKATERVAAMAQAMAQAVQ